MCALSRHTETSNSSRVEDKASDNPADLVGLIQKAPILPTVYPTDVETLCRYADILHEEGYPALELLGRPHEQALTAMSRIVESPQRHKIKWGLGTVRNHAAARQAVALRPDFIVSPAFSRRVLDMAVQADVPYIPGVHTFQNVQDVIEAFEDCGLTVQVLKLCPVFGLTAEYVQALRGCFPGIVFCPTGEITFENYLEWKQIPGIVAPMGSQLVPKDWLDTGDFESVRHRLRQYRELAGKAAKDA
jgi:2-dehydro-3-deoxyphosphogluconate aldolase/(4S)-4-hydroxy-2-oxoglutarate aldolase